MAGINSCTFIGNIGKAPDTKYTPNGTAKTTFSIAVNSRRKQGDGWVDDTTWIPLVLWKHEGLLNYLQPGTQVYVNARYTPRTWDKDGEKRTFHEFTVSEIQLLGGKRGAAQPDAHDVPAKEWQPAGVDTDDIPF